MQRCITMASAIVFGKGLPKIQQVQVARTVELNINTGVLTDSFQYNWTGYVVETSSGGYQDIYIQDPKLISKAELVAVTVAVPPGNPMTPDTDTVLRLENSKGGIDFSFGAADTNKIFKADNTDGLPWILWQGLASDSFDNLKLVVKSAGTFSAGNRAHQMLSFRSLIKLTLR